MEIQNRQFIRVVDQNALDALQTGLHGRIIQPDHPEYNNTRKVWNGMVDRYPALIMQCSDPQDVVQAIRFAREQNLDIAVRGGGHGIPGYATIDNGIVIDLSGMKDLRIDPQRQTALASAGLTLGEFIRATQAHGLVTPVGTDPNTGIAGLTLGGGVGSLSGKFGLTCDNVLSFEMVTVNGEIVRASPQENSELYWGLRGGSGNFGIVTSFEFQLHPGANILAGVLVHPLTRARTALRFYRDFTRQMPDELTAFCALNYSPDGHPVVGFLVCYCGDLEEGQRVLEPLRKFGPPVVDLVRPIPYLDLLYMSNLPQGRRYYGKGSTQPELSDLVIEALIEAAEANTSLTSEILIQHVHGAAARVAPDATAFSARGNSYMPFILAEWDEGPDEPHVEWTRNTWASLQPYSVGSAYVNFLGMEGQNRVESAYGSNYTRLVELKRRYDPENIFHMNPNIRPD
jgi:UDP-N-acetylenolpyruvoylglucosamine reductase